MDFERHSERAMEDTGPLGTRFLEDVRTSSFRPFTTAEAGAIVERECLSGTLLTQLTDAEHRVLAGYLTMAVLTQYNTAMRRAIAEEPLVRIDNDMDFLDHLSPKDLGALPSLGRVNLLNLGRPRNNQWQVIADGAGLQPLTPGQRIGICTNPELWASTYLHQDDGLSSPDVRPYAYRNLLGYEVHGFPNTESGFVALLRHIRERQQKNGKDPIRMLDVGGAMGRALWEAQQIDPAIVTYNLTPHEEPARWPTNHFRLSGGETMPADWREQMDLIVSSWAIMYCVYPDIALRNCVEALAPGGEAHLDYGTVMERTAMSYHTGPEGQAALSRRMAGAFRWLLKLRKQSNIEVTGCADEWGEETFWTRESELGSFNTHRTSLCIRKIHSLDAAMNDKRAETSRKTGSLMCSGSDVGPTLHI